MTNKRTLTQYDYKMLVILKLDDTRRWLDRYVSRYNPGLRQLVRDLDQQIHIMRQEKPDE